MGCVVDAVAAMLRDEGDSVGYTVPIVNTAVASQKEV